MRKLKITEHLSRTDYDSREEWLAHRYGIGGSDASAVVGNNPYKSNQELYLELTGQLSPEDISDKPYVQYGIAAEPYLRELFALDHPGYKVGYTENNIWTNEKYPWAHASLDGWLMDSDGRLGVLEIKTTNILQSMQREKWNDGIPENYYDQLIHYLMVTGFDFAILKAQLKYEYEGEPSMSVRHYMIERAEVEEDIEFLKNKERKFWKSVKTGRKPALVLPEI